jgi:predicted transcriptional regulator
VLRYRFGDKPRTAPYHDRMDLRDWGALLRRMRKQKFSNAGDFATAVGVSKRTVENWEAGNHWPEAPHMAQLVRVLGPEIDPGAVGQLNRIEAKLDEMQSAFDRVSAGLIDLTRRLGSVGRDAE